MLEIFVETDNQFALYMTRLFRVIVSYSRAITLSTIKVSRVVQNVVTNFIFNGVVNFFTGIINFHPCR